MKYLVIILISISSLQLSSQHLAVEQFNKKFEIAVFDPSLSIHAATGLIYQDIDETSFTNLNDEFLRIADGPFGYQFQPNSTIYSELGKNFFSINHYYPSGTFGIGPYQRASWGPRNSASPFHYDLNTFGDIFSKDLSGRRLAVLSEYSGGALYLYKYSGIFTYEHRLSINSAGNVQWMAVSDRRVKENISDTKGILPRVLKLNLKNYNYIGLNELTTGFIAQEVQEVFPDLVSEINDGLLGVNYAGFSPLAIQAIKEQQEIINSLEERISQIEERLGKE